MSARMGKFQVDQGELVFPTAEDVAGYNQIITRIKVAAARQVQVAEAMQRDAQKLSAEVPELREVKFFVAALSQAGPTPSLDP